MADGVELRKAGQYKGMSETQARGLEEQERMQEASALHQSAMFRLQQKANEQAADMNAKSSIEKAKHDALMNIANNIK